MSLFLHRIADALMSPLRPAYDKELRAFIEAAKRWKPMGFDEEMALRMRYYLGDQEEDVRNELRRQFPLSYDRMPLHTVRLTRKVIDARAKLFGKGSKLAMVRGEDAPAPKPVKAPEAPEELDGEDGDEETTPVGPQPYAPDSPEGKRWGEILKGADLIRRLRTVNRWAENMNTVVAVVGYDKAKDCPTVTIFAPHFVHVDFDPVAPLDMDKANGVLLEVAGESGTAKVSQKLEDKRFEFWSADPTNPEHYLIDGAGKLVDAPNVDGRNPYRDPVSGLPVIPLVPFFAEEPELGFFTMANGDLVRANRSINVTLTDEHAIARAQGFGQIYIKRDGTAGGDDGDAARSDIAFGPEKAVILRRGEDAGVLSTNPQLVALEGMVTSDAKRVTSMWDVPAGTVLADSRTAASAEALVVEREPQAEAREDQIDRYRASVERLFDVIRIVNNTHAAPVKALPAGARLTWEPGDLRIPFSPQAEQDVDLIDLEHDLTTLPAILAKRRGISVEDATKLLEENRKTNERFKKVPDAPPGDLMAAFSADARSRFNGKPPPAKPPEEKPEP